MKKLVIGGIGLASVALLAVGIGTFARWAGADTRCGELTWESAAGWNLGIDPVDESGYWFHYHQFVLQSHGGAQAVYFSLDTTASSNIAQAWISETGSGYTGLSAEPVSIDFGSHTNKTIYIRSRNTNTAQNGNIVVRFTPAGEKYRHIGWQTCEAPE
jgi:hypothetical protein